MNASHSSTGPAGSTGPLRRTRPSRWLALAALPLLAGCSGLDAGLGVGGGSDDELTDTLGAATSEYVVLDLATGRLAPPTAVPDLGTNAAYRSSSMVFRRVHGLGDDFLLGVFEVTQAQWTLIAGAPAGGIQPWDATVIAPSLVGTGAVGDGKPAFNLSYAAIESALAGYGVGKSLRLEVPTTEQWRYACAAGGSGAWSWGDDASYPTLLQNAVVYETQGDTVGTKGPQTVGGRRANAFGFFDMHGNVWEWTSPGTSIHGGSWHDSYVQARTANEAGVLDAGIVDLTDHALIGVRLKLHL